jgi:hypothetical protein
VPRPTAADDAEALVYDHDSVSFVTEPIVIPNLGGHLSGPITNAAINNAVITLAMLTATGTPSSTTYLRGDNSWQVPPGTGGGGGGGADTTILDHPSPGISETFDWSAARIHTMTLDSSSCALSFSGWPASGQYGEMLLWLNHGTGTTERTITLPAGTRTPYAMPLVIPTNIANAEYQIRVFTKNAGSTLYADLVGSEYGVP